MTEKVFKSHSPIQEILDWVSSPYRLSERAERYIFATNRTPFLKEVIKEIFAPEVTYDQVNNFYSEDVINSLRFHNTLDFKAYWKKDHKKFSDQDETWNAKRKWEILTDILNYMSESDARFVIALMQRKHEIKGRINPLFLKTVDPDLLGKPIHQVSS